MSTYSGQMLLFIFAATFCIVRVDGFRSISYTIRHKFPLKCETTGTLTAATPSAWPGNRPPVTNLERIEQRMDATWGRGKYRTEVWEDDVNPVDFWWKAYEPSQEELEAMDAGFDFNDGKKWLEERGFDYKAAQAETLALTAARYEEFRKKRDDAEKNFNMKAFEEKERLVKANPLTDPAEMAAFEEQVRMAFRIRFRQEDNRLQALKGQPSLDNEDTGSQWLIHT